MHWVSIWVHSVEASMKYEHRFSSSLRKSNWVGESDKVTRWVYLSVTERSRSVWPSGPSGIKNFQSRDFQDWVLQNPGIPGFLRTGAHKFGQFRTFWRTILFVKYIRQTKVSSIPSCGKQQERAGVHCCWQRGDPKKSLPHTRESRCLSYCQIQPWSVKGHGLSK